MVESLLFKGAGVGARSLSQQQKNGAAKQLTGSATLVGTNE